MFARILLHRARAVSSSCRSSFSTADALFQEYVDTQARAKELNEEKERKRSTELYNAWKKSSETATNPKSTGVAVVKTIVRQANQDKKSLKQKQSSSLEDQIEECHAKADKLLQELARVHRHPSALVLLGNQAVDEGAVHDALDYYQQACDLGSKEGCFNHGNLLWTGSLEASDDNDDDELLKPNRERALESFYQAIELGDTDAMYFVGTVLLSDDDDDDASNHTGDDNGTASAKHPTQPTQQQLEQQQQGLTLIHQAADAEHPGALYYLALFYYNGHEALGIPPCPPDEYRRRLDAAVAAGDPDAAYVRGHAYATDNCPDAALRDWEAAANAGHADAAVSAGALWYRRGQPRQAFAWYQRAGELGSVEGWRNVVACYLRGDGVPASIETAQYIAQTMLLGKEDEEKELK